MQKVDYYDPLAVAQGIAALIAVVLNTADMNICLTTVQIAQ
jgi:hypothetical protein